MRGYNLLWVSVIITVKALPDVVEAVNVMWMRESGDELLFAVAEALGDTDIAVWIFAKDAHVVLRYQEWITGG